MENEQNNLHCQRNLSTIQKGNFYNILYFFYISIAVNPTTTKTKKNIYVLISSHLMSIHFKMQKYFIFVN